MRAAVWWDDGGVTSQPQIVSVNVGRVETFEHHGRTVSSAIAKRPVSGRIGTAGFNLVGDDQADRSVHGGPDRAVYAYAVGDLEWWAAELGRPVPPGSMGENLTTIELDVTGAVIGERWRVGSITLEVSAPRVPCYKLGIRMGDPRFPQRFAHAGRPGAYLRIVEHGDVAAGDPIVVADRPEHGITVSLVARAYHDDHTLAARLLDAPALGGGWPEWARRHVA
jgi:MOSC domain-containing protein YiiM